MKTTRKILALALALCICMVLGVVPAVQATSEQTIAEENFQLSNAGATPRGWTITSLANNGLLDAGANWAGSYSLEAVEETDGNMAIAVNKEGVGYAALTSPAVAVEEGASYLLSYSYRTSAVEILNNATADYTFWGMKATVHFYDESDSELADTRLVVNNSVVGATVSETWTSVSYQFQAVSGAAYAKVFFGLGGQKNAYAQILIDNFGIIGATGDSLINGSFDHVIYEADGARTADVAGPWGWTVVSSNADGSTITGQNANFEKQYIVSTVEENGNAVMKMEPDPSPYGYAVALSNYIPAKANTTYTLTYDQKVENGENAVANYPYRIRIYYFDSSLNLLSSYNRKGTNVSQDWTSKMETVTTPENTAYIAVGFFAGGTGKGYAYYYDNVAISEYCLNGDFEHIVSNVPYNWTKTSMTSGCEIETEHAWANNYVLSSAAGSGVDGSTAASLTKNSTGYAAMTSGLVAAEGGKSYRLSYTYKTTAVENTTATNDFFGIHAVAACLDVDGNTVTDGWILLNDTGYGKGQTVSADWDTICHDFVAPDGTENIRIYLCIGGKQSVVATVLFDNVTLTQYADNELVNGDLEGIYNGVLGGRTGATDGPSGWSAMTTNSGGAWNSAGTNTYVNNYTVTTVTEADGNKVMKIAPCTASTGTRGYMVAYSQPMAVEAATTYTLTYDQKIDVGESQYQGAKILFYYFNENMEFIGNDWKASSTEAHDWQAMSNTITTRNNTAYMIVGFFMGGAWDKNTGIAYYYDDVAVEKDSTTYTVTYVADGVTVDTYTVKAGEATPAVPKIPAKIGYSCAWDHDGTNITADTTITAVYTQDVNVADWGVILGEDIGVKIRLQIGKANVSHTAVKLTVNGEESNASLRAEGGYYVINVKMAAAQMTDRINVAITCGDVVIEKDYSVADYAMTILEGDYDDVTKALVAEMLNYGVAAQEYFSYNQDAEINTNLLPEGTGSQEIDPAAATDMVIEDSADGISFYGATLLFKSKTAVRFYFNVTGDISGYTFAAGETALTPVEKDGLYYVEIGNINPQDLANQITVTVTAGEQALAVSYGPMNYVVRKNETGSDSLKALVKAMYNYYLAAVAYVNAAA